MSLLAAIKLIAGLMLALLLFFGGRSCGVQAHRSDAEQLQRLVDAKGRALHAASRSFAAFAATFQAVDANTQAEVSEASRREALAQQAAGHAAASESSAVLRARRFEEALEKAKRSRPGCPVVMQADLEVACGITLQ